MEQIEELQSRIEAALDRIGGGVTALEEKHASQPVPTLEELDMQKHAELLAEIADEKMANAQLEERLKLLRGRLSEMEETVKAVEGGADLIALQAELAETRDAAPAPEAEEVAVLKAEVGRLKQELESARNSAASETERLQDDLTEANAQIEQFQAQLDETPAAPSGAAAMADAAPVDAGAGAELDMRLSELDGELQTLRASNDQLREANAALRAANAEGVGDATLINAALEAEVEGLRAARATDQAEVNAVLARLEPLLATAPNLPEGEEA